VRLLVVLLCALPTSNLRALHVAALQRTVVACCLALASHAHASAVSDCTAATALSYEHARTAHTNVHSALTLLRLHKRLHFLPLLLLQDPRAAGIGTREAIRMVWSCHREIILDEEPVPDEWEVPNAT
jgi:glucokinase